MINKTIFYKGNTDSPIKNQVKKDPKATKLKTVSNKTKTYLFKFCQVNIL